MKIVSVAVVMPTKFTSLLIVARDEVEALIVAREHAETFYSDEKEFHFATSSREFGKPFMYGDKPYTLSLQEV